MWTPLGNRGLRNEPARRIRRITDSSTSRAAPAKPSGHYDRLYRSGGFGYEETRKDWEEWVARHYVTAFGLEPGQKLLDVPCGDGFWSSVFAKAGFEVVGVDLSPGGVEMARRRYSGIEFVAGNAEEPLPLSPGSFDIVFSRSITHLHHRELFSDRAFRMVANLMGYVKPGGILLISYHTKRDSAGTEHHAYHPVSDLVKLVESAADPFRIEVVDDYVQVGAWHRQAPRRFSHLGQRIMRSRLRGLARRFVGPVTRTD